MNLFKRLFAKKEKVKSQGTQVFCSCGNELIADAENGIHKSFIRDIYIGWRNVVHYKCSKCKADSYWDFDHIAPLSLPLSEDDNIIDLYKIEYPVND